MSTPRTLSEFSSRFERVMSTMGRATRDEAEWPLIISEEILLTNVNYGGNFTRGTSDLQQNETIRFWWHRTKQDTHLIGTLRALKQGKWNTPLSVLSLSIFFSFFFFHSFFHSLLVVRFAIRSCVGCSCEWWKLVILCVSTTSCL